MELYGKLRNGASPGATTHAAGPLPAGGCDRISRVICDDDQALIRLRARRISGFVQTCVTVSGGGADLATKAAALGFAE